MQDNDRLQKFTIIKCLKLEVPEYFEYKKQFYNVLNRELSVNDSPSSFSKAYENFSINSSFFHEVDLSIKEKEEFSKFKYDIGLPLILFGCTQGVELEKSLSVTEKEFYKSFNESIKDGAMNTFELAKILGRIDSENFTSNGVKEVALFYLVFEMFNCVEVWN